MTPATERKRRQLLAFVEQVVVAETAVQGIVAIGSIASGAVGGGVLMSIVGFIKNAMGK